MSQSTCSGKLAVPGSWGVSWAGGMLREPRPLTHGQQVSEGLGHDVLVQEPLTGV